MSVEAEYAAMNLAIREVTNAAKICKQIAYLRINAVLYKYNKAATELVKIEESKNAEASDKFVFSPYTRSCMKETSDHHIREAV